MRIFLVVLDGVGAGEQPDSRQFGDAGADTLGHVLRHTGVALPNLAQMGLYNMPGTSFEAPRPCQGCYGRMLELSQGKDTTTGHWEMAGIVTERPFPTYPDGFPPEVIDAFVQQTGVPGVLGNCAASGTEIIQRLGDEHVRSGNPIVYTSADSVFQIAAHEGIIPLERLYELCRAARALLQGPHAVGRVIARPFEGSSGAYRRTANRRDFSLEPPKGHLLDVLVAAAVKVTAIGKIEDIFAGRSIDQWLPTHSNAEGLAAVLRCMREGGDGFYFANLVDFDMIYGHRNDAAGFAEALKAVDDALPAMRAALAPGDALFFTADHGVDPCYPGTDHTREHVPLLAWGPDMRRGVNLGIRRGYMDLGQTIADSFGVSISRGQSMKLQLWGKENE